MVVIVGFSLYNLNEIEHEVNQTVDDAIPLGIAASSIVSGLIDQETASSAPALANLAIELNQMVAAFRLK